MSGSAGGNRISRAAVENTVKDYIEKVLSKFPGFKSAKITGSYNAGTKQDFGDVDLIVQLDGEDKKLLKQDLAKFFATQPDSVIVPFKSDKYKGKKSLSSGELVTILYPIVGMPNEFVQIDNIISVSEEESTFKNSFLDYSAEVQGLLLGLAKVICLEEDPKEIFARLSIKNVPALEPNQEYEFNLSGAALTLRVVTLDNFKETERTDVWKSSNWNDVRKLFTNYNIDADFKTLLKDLSTNLKNPRSKNRVKGIFKSMVSIKSGEVGTPKGDNKQLALNSVDSLLEANALVRELLLPLLFEQASNPIIALYPGKFKPPHKGHFEVAKKLLNIADKIEILISAKPVEGITAEQSKAVWDLYNTLLDGKLDIKIISGSPVKYVLDIIEANQNNNYIAVYGKGEESRYINVGKDPRYMNAKIFDGGTTVTQDGNINATDFRQALQSGQDISKFLPTEISSKEVNNIFNLQEEMSQADLASVEVYADKELAPNDIDFTKHFFDRLNDPRNIKPISPAELIGFFKRLARKKNELNDFLFKYREIVASDNRTNINIPLVQMSDKIIAKTIMRKKNFQTPDPKIELNENCGCQQPNTFKQALASLTKYMINQGYNITPLPKLIIINSDTKNAENILGKTAYYNPNNCSITLYTLNRHPKDVLRSYSHEMIHRIQDNEGRLNNVNTTNTNEDSNLQELEKEAYLNGNIIFRNWEDEIKSKKYLNEYKQYALNELFEKDLPIIDKVDKNLYIVSNGNDIEAKYDIRLEIPERDLWSVNWFFTSNNKNKSPEAWKQVTATSFKILEDWLKTNNPKVIHISGNTGAKTKLYKNYIDKLQTILNNKYKIDNSDEDKIVLRSIEETYQSNIKKRIETLNETYDQALNYWQNGDINSKSKIERWDTIKRKVKREILQELYNIKNAI
jgi:predicted nucleotidyltransferase